MKRRMRKAKAARQVVLKKKHHDDDEEDADDEGTVPDRTVASSDDSTQTTPSDESSNTPERWHRVQVKGEDDEDGRFPRSFALDFPEVPFAAVPETPVKKAPSKEPVWKKRLRYQGMSPSANERKPLRLNDDVPSKAEENEILRKKDNGVSRQEEHENQHGGKESHRPDAESIQKPVKLSSKSVSFDKTGIEASRKTRKKHALRRKQDKILKAFEEESFDQLFRTESGFSDVFFDLFEEEDFSLATPTIYTDEATDESSIESSYEARGEKLNEAEEEEHDEEDEEGEESHLERRTSSRALSPREDYYVDDDFDFSTIGGCRGVAVFEELKMLTELFIPEQRCICAKPEEEIPSRGRSRRRRSRQSRSRS
eukprot:scaffold448_cov156-Amphora_coffeaeformis.AAC.8